MGFYLTGLNCGNNKHIVIGQVSFISIPSNISLKIIWWKEDDVYKHKQVLTYSVHNGLSLTMI